MKLLDDIRRRIRARRAERARYICAHCSRSWRIRVERCYRRGELDPDVDIPAYGSYPVEYFGVCDICRESRLLRRTRAEWIRAMTRLREQEDFLEAPE